MSRAVWMMGNCASNAEESGRPPLIDSTMLPIVSLMPRSKLPGTFLYSPSGAERNVGRVFRLS